MNKSQFKENSKNLTTNESAKRRKMGEQNMSEISKCNTEEKDSNLSVTIYEDESDINDFNKSTMKRIASTSVCKRSPLATINKSMNKSKSQDSAIMQPSTSKKLLNQTEFIQRKAHVKTITTIDPFSFISDEILLHVFQYLPKKALNRVALVNRRFNRVVQDECLWIRMDMGNRALGIGAIGKLISRGLIILRLAQARIKSPIFEPDFYENFQSKLQYLDLSVASIDKESLVKLLHACQSLKKLSLEAVPVDDNVCKKIAGNRSLEVLNLAMCDGITTKGVLIMIVSLQSLVALNISWTQLSIDSVLAVVSNISPSLMRLNISGCRKSFTDSALEILVNRCPYIVELDVSDCPMLTAATIQTVAALDKLEYLSLSRCYNIPMASYINLNSMKSLAYLDVFGLLSDAGLQMLEKTFKNIGINKFIHSSIARPTVAPRRTSIWGLRTRDTN